MKISVIGSGYVGLVTGACLSDVGHIVTCVDNNKDKIDMLNRGEMPIFEKGLKELVQNNVEDNRLFFTTDIKKATENACVIFIAVGTPPDEDGSADLQYVLAVAKDIGNYMNGYKVVVDKSTVPVGTADYVKSTIADVLKSRNADHEFDVVSNPEFLKEGVAIDDFMKPDRVVIGTESERAKNLMHEVYSAFTIQHDRIIFMGIRSAEMTKYAANAMLATKISFMNEISRLCEEVNADVEDVRTGIGSDHRIGYSFIYPGIGYGGSCFPKDVKALIKIAHKHNSTAKILEAVEEVNDEQKLVMVEKIVSHFGENLKDKVFALWGLSFKPMTDDMREAPSRVIIRELIKRGAKIQAYDPEAMKESKRIFGNHQNIKYFDDQYDAVKNADALVLITEWRQFRMPDFEKVYLLLKEKNIFDGRNQYEPDQMKKIGFTYYCIGRPSK
ncbi:MAG: UDP-glucose/GDP-mannose dehydrogenase family protein [Candidatus Cloacimonetes bacterium]|nr:UDP-glucose/GDP-mannose dehydrogenase family protein [Candidatus Cloacimonadota bacterium]